MVELKALSHDAIFLAICNAILLLTERYNYKIVKFSEECLICKDTLAKCNKEAYLTISHLKGRIALQVARKIALCGRALSINREGRAYILVEA